ncbi:hypothetical protein [Cohnella thailandensis]|uniref:Uncharacterized protein n=1 Tax=Cohnella thailandensis TaxID=557557 RepID=A0A841SZM4_9BACL|nr:hypothetical protein [Cohnella thailandensis]MBB6635598.1 hypothetical protein [Cohnella thailandensis]MBP1974978.1 hypothetical protein [Cohnella thailandensis]
MAIKKWNLAIGGALAVALLSGCGSNNTDNAASEGAQVQADAGATQQAQGQGGPGGGFGGGMVDENGNAADMLGKIKSINGNTITVYKSSIDPSQMGGGMRGQGGQGGPGGDGGQPPSGAPDANGGQAPADGQASADAQAAADGQAAPSGAPDGGNGGGRPQGGGMANMFTEETVDIAVTDATVIQKTSFENNEVTTTDVALSELKADDVLTIWLTEGTQEAATIKLGGFGGGMGRGGQGGPQGQGQGQAGEQAAASGSSAAQ